MMLMLLRFSLWCAIALPSAAFGGELTWQETTKQVAVAWGATQAEAEFVGENTSTTEVTVTKVAASCACTLAKMDEDKIQPGASTRMKVVIKIGERTGRLETPIIVSTGPKVETTILRLTTIIPQIVRTQPDRLAWRMGDENTPKTMIIETLPGFIADFELAGCSRPDIKATLVVLQAGRRYQLIVFPSSTEGTFLGEVRLRGEVRAVDADTKPVAGQIKQLALAVAVE